MYCNCEIYGYCCISLRRASQLSSKAILSEMASYPNIKPSASSISALNGTICSVFEVFDTFSAYAILFSFCKDEDLSIPDSTPRGHVLPRLPDSHDSWRLPGCRAVSPLYVRIRSYYSDEAILNADRPADRNAVVRPTSNPMQRRCKSIQA